MRNLIFSLLAFTLVMGCKSGKIYQATPAPVEDVITETRDLDTLVVTAPRPDKLKTAEDFKLPDYNPSYKRRNDLIHTKLDLRFNWAQQQVLGKATLTLRPKFYPVNVLELDAKGFDIRKVSFEGASAPLKYDYDDSKLVIDLGKEFTRDQEYKIFIDYTANPAEGERGGSAAITSDQGLFFINHDGSDASKPMQIWTQGETEWNSRWFPTIDKPNERCTQEMYLTVQDKFKTLSNGLKISSTPNADGTRTDYWKMDMPHAPYLFMIAVGDFAVVEDKWNGMTVDYYVEPAYKESARGIFSNTVEMLDFFSKKLGVKYPWQKYSQVVVRDYVSGAMENTTGVIFGEFVQKTNRELIDNHNERIVAHELFHHWFGDLVTCESWANLTMNEGFANYSEYLWFEHKYGKDEADYHLFNEMQGYLGSAAQQGVHPLIHFGYKDKEDMFDAHSYNKGGLVLHMLRNYVGDEAFFAALQLYLNTHEFTAVEAHDLRLAFEDVCGEDMNWFFNQWYFSAGHPSLSIETNFNEETSAVDITLEQTQNTDRMPAIFQLPMAVDIYLKGQKPLRKYITMNERKQSFSFKVPERPALINVDADKMTLMEKEEDKSEEEYVYQFYNAPKFLDQYEAIAALSGSELESAKQLFVDALKNDFWMFRAQALESVDLERTGVKDQLFELAQNDPHSSVRAAAIEKLAMTGEAK
ncbi:MAG: M1 family metallopeptidase, partial [Bacteroidota bacterium]